MDSTQTFDALKHIKLGIKEIFYFNYDGDPLPLRPISSYELDDCFHNSLRNANSKVFDLVLKLRLELIDRKAEVDFGKADYVYLQRYYNEISYWIVYHSMKDFQGEDFTTPIIKDAEFLPRGMFLVRQMNYVHDIANLIMDSSYKPKEFIAEIIKDDYGKEIARCVFYLNAPLGNLMDLTRLQRDYLVYSKGELVGKLTPSSSTEDKKKQYIISGQKMTMAEVIKRFYGRDVLENIKKKIEKQEKENEEDPFSHIKLIDIKKKIEEEKNANSR